MTPKIFLDFDGVMNRRALGLSMVKAFKGRIRPELFDPMKVKLLNMLTDATGSTIVISSGWRVLSSLESIKRSMADAGITAEVVGKTPFFGDQRGREVETWLRVYTDKYACGVRPPYIIFDDKEDPSFEQHGRRFIQTDPATGLTPDDIKQAADVLGGRR